MVVVRFGPTSALVTVQDVAGGFYSTRFLTITVVNTLQIDICSMSSKIYKAGQQLTVDAKVVEHGALP